MNERPDWMELARYVAGECSRSEEAEIAAWGAASEANGRVLEDARRTWRLARVRHARQDARLAWAQVRAQIRAQAPPSPWRSSGSMPASREVRVGSRFSVAWAAAAGIAAVLAAGALSLLWQPAGTAHNGFAAQEVITENGEHARVRLIDGSEVALAPGSRLKVPPEFAVAARAVELSGEAYFDVAPDRSRPFTVRAGDGVAEVLGTEFNVRAYPGDAAIRLVVAEGSVAFGVAGQAEEAATVLTTGELGELRPDEPEVVTRAADLERDLAWRQGRLIFHETPLSEVAREIERWYGVPVRVAHGAIASRRVTASFRHQPLDEVAMVIATSLGLECVRIGEAYVFRLKEKEPALAAL